MTKLDDFKVFLKSHPLLRDEVNSKRMTWQSIYEEWVLFNDDSMWDKYKVKSSEDNIKDNIDSKSKSRSEGDDMVKNILSYVKKIDPDTVNKYVTSIQKVLELVTSFGIGGIVGNADKKKTTDPLFDRRFDEWY